MSMLGAAIASLGAAAQSLAASSFMGSILVNTAVSTGLSLLARAAAPKATLDQSGLQTAVTTAGGTEPQAFILGRTATAGHHVCPPMSHDDGGTPNGYLTYVIDLSDVPGVALRRVIVNDGYSALGEETHGDYGTPLLGQRVAGKDHAWIKIHDGHQTAADPMLVDKYAADPDRPWSSAFIGTGTAYAVATFRYNRAVFNALPKLRFELDGIALYDPRRDSTLGGEGAQTWADPSTWEASANPAVMIYNILRGIALPTGEVWGGGVPAEDLPLDNWIAAMNACDTPVEIGADAGSRPSFEAGLEVKISAEPAEVMEELAKTCLGQISEMGGVFRLRVGAPAAPVAFITDDDIVVSAPQELDPFPGLAASANAVSCHYLEPESLWTSHAPEPLINPAWEAEDGDRRLTTALSFPACASQGQAAQLMDGYINDARRFRTHRLVLPPRAFSLEPLDTIAWTSAQNGYDLKIFEVVEIIDQPGTVNQELVLRERDPGDYSWSSDGDLPALAAITGLTQRPAQLIEGWSVAASALQDALGVNRRPAITLSWEGSAAADALFVRYEIRVQATAQVVATGLADRAPGAALVSEGLLPETAYEVRGQYALDRAAEWSSWLGVTTPSLYLQGDDLLGGIKGLMDAADLAPVEILAALPDTDNFVGRTVFLTADNKLYRWTGSAWTAGLAASDIEGEVGEDQIAAGAVTADKIAAQAVSSDKIAAGAITAGLLAAGAVNASAIGVNTLSALVANIGVFRSATTGARLEIQDDVIRVYDENNQLVIKIGNLA